MVMVLKQETSSKTLFPLVIVIPKDLRTATLGVFFLRKINFVKTP